MHEECLTGLAAWKAATFPTPLAWGAAFDPELVEQVGAVIGRSMRQLGIHQGLAPVLDVIRDPRWGRVDECIGEDPYLVGTVGTAYVRGPAGRRGRRDAQALPRVLGVAGRAQPRARARRAARGRRRLPAAVRDGAARRRRPQSVMNSYAEIDGVPVAANVDLLTGLLRDQLGFEGTVVADYFSVAFLEVMHGIAADRGEAAAMALSAGIDVELPTGRRVPRAARRPRPRRGRRRGARRPRRAAGPAAEGAARAARPGRVRGRRPHRHRPRHRAAPGPGTPAGRRSLVLLSNDGVAAAAGPRRRDRLGMRPGPRSR